MKRTTRPEGGYQTSFRVVTDAFTQAKELVHSELRRATLGLVMELYQQEVEELCGPRFSRKSEHGFYRGGSDPTTVLARRWVLTGQSPSCLSSRTDVGR